MPSTTFAFGVGSLGLVLMMCTGATAVAADSPIVSSSKEVKWGDQSWEEMLVGFYDVAVNPKITNKTIYKKME